MASRKKKTAARLRKKRGSARATHAANDTAVNDTAVNDTAGASGAIALALTKLLAFHGSPRKVAELTGLSVGQVRRLRTRGLGPRQARNAEYVTYVLERLYRELSAIYEVKERRERAELLPARKVQRAEARREGMRLNAWAKEFRSAGLRSLVRSDNGNVKMEQGMSVTQPSPYPHIAECLSFDNVAELRRWGSARKVPDARVSEVIAAVSAREYVVGKSARAQMRDLISQARRGSGPGIEPYVPGDSRMRGRASNSVEMMGPFRASRGITESDGRVGFHWGQGFNQFLSYALIDKIFRWCLSRKLPPSIRRGRRKWQCVAVCAEYYPQGVEPPKKTKSDRSLRRTFEETGDAELQKEAKRFTFNQGRASGRFSFLEQAARQLRNVLVERSELDLLTYVQGVNVYSWRPETPSEERRRVEEEQRRGQLARSEKQMEKLAQRERARRQKAYERLSERHLQSEFDEIYEEQERRRRELKGAPSATTRRDHKEYLRRVRRKGKKK